MKAISLWQPWATAIAVGAKRIETRSWSTVYRGSIAIHAARRWGERDMDNLLRRSALWRAVLDHPLTAISVPVNPPGFDVKRSCGIMMPVGAIVAVAQLVDVVPTSKATQWLTVDGRRSHSPLGEWTERDLGDYSPGRYAWVLHGVQPVWPPRPCVGRQGLFNVPDREAAGGAA